MIQTILVPIDGSNHADTALDLAGDLAGKFGAKLILLHVVPNGRLPEELRRLVEVEHLAVPVGAEGTGPASIPARFGGALHDVTSRESDLRAFEAVGRKIIESGERAARDKGVAEVRGALERGDAAARILELADREKADMIVMGSRGLGDLKGLLLGSVSHKVAHLAKCTCVTVK